VNTSSPRARLIAATATLALTGALFAAGPAPATADPGAPAFAQAAPGGSDDSADRQADAKKKKKKGKVVWDSTSYVAYAGAVVAHGKVPGKKKKVLLQVKVPGRWKTFAKTKSDKKGKFAISGSLDWYGTHKVRVTTKGKKGFSKRKKVTVSTAYPLRGNPSDYKFLSDSGLRFMWNPCKTVRYAVNADDVGPNGIAMVQQAMLQVSAATGIKTKYVGTSSQIPNVGGRDKLPKGQDLLVAWGDKNEVPEFQGSAIGYAGPEYAYRARTAKGKSVWMTTQATVALETDAYNSGDFTQGFIGPKPAWAEVVLHEIGHAFGLDHSNGTEEIMYFQAGAGVWPDGLFRGLYSAGDLTGLKKVGLDNGCVRKVRSRTGAKILSPGPTARPFARH
jgi:hypothetical protein